MQNRHGIHRNPWKSYHQITYIKSYRSCILRMVAFHLSEQVFIDYHDIKSCKILTNVVPNYPFAPKGNLFLESWLTSLLPTYWALSSYISEKSIVLIIKYKVAQFWLELSPNSPFPLKRDFNWLILILSTSCTPS